MSAERKPTDSVRLSLGCSLLALGTLRAWCARGTTPPPGAIDDAIAVAVAHIESALTELDALDATVVDLKADVAVGELKASGMR